MLKECTSFIEIFEFIFAGNREPDLFAAVIWSLWNRHKNLRLGKPALPLDKVLDFAWERLTEHPSSTSTSSNPQQHPAATWIALEAHGFKVNFDGATFVDNDTTRLGVVIRNDASLVIPMPSLVIEVEVLAARRALELALELGFDNIILEGDSEILLKALKNGASRLSHYGHLTSYIFFLISHFSTLKLSFV